MMMSTAQFKRLLREYVRDVLVETIRLSELRPLTLDGVKAWNVEAYPYLLKIGEKDLIEIGEDDPTREKIEEFLRDECDFYTDGTYLYSLYTLYKLFGRITKNGWEPIFDWKK